MVKDGFTVALGGLMESSEGTLETKVPVLGDLPMLGRLFRDKSDEVTKRNLIIFLTAKTLNPDGSSYRDVVDQRTLDEMGILPSDVPGYDIPESERALLEQIEALKEDVVRLKRERELEGRLESLRAADDDEASPEASESDEGEQ